jgi:hypothetical protein
MEYKCIYRLSIFQQKAFTAFPEVYRGVQMGLLTHGGRRRVVCLVVSGLVAVVIEDGLQQELEAFLRATWRPVQPSAISIIQRYEDWLKLLTEPDQLEPIDAPREWVAFSASTNTPPPPPNRTSVVPSPAGPPFNTAVYGHLPFLSVTEDSEVFFRCEAWPTSRRVQLGTNTVVADTFASPRLEAPFLPTGFAAVARSM